MPKFFKRLTGSSSKKKAKQQSASVAATAPTRPQPLPSGAGAPRPARPTTPAPTIAQMQQWSTARTGGPAPDRGRLSRTRGRRALPLPLVVPPSSESSSESSSSESEQEDRQTAVPPPQFSVLAPGYHLAGSVIPGLESESGEQQPEEEAAAEQVVAPPAPQFSVLAPGYHLAGSVLPGLEDEAGEQQQEEDVPGYQVVDHASAPFSVLVPGYSLAGSGIPGLEEDSDESESEQEDLGQELVEEADQASASPDQAQAEVAPTPTVNAEVRKHRAWLVKRLGTQYDNERTDQRADLVDAARALALEIMIWFRVVTQLETVSGSDATRIRKVLKLVASDHPVHTLTDLTDVLPMAREVHAGLLEKARRQDLPVTEEGRLGDLTDRLVEYDDQGAQERSLVLVGGQRLHRNDQARTRVDTEQSSTFHTGLGAEIFVVGQNNDMHMASHKIGKFHHSSLLGGAEVSMAGEMQVTKGRIDWISNKSGHYMPTAVQFQQFLQHLGKDVPLTFPVHGWGVPAGVTAQDIVDGVDDTGTRDEARSANQQKMQVVLNAWAKDLGVDGVTGPLEAEGWTVVYTQGRWTVTDDQGGPVAPELVRRALKGRYGARPVAEA